MSEKIRDNSGRFISNWNDEDLNFLKKYYELYSNEYISYKLNKTIDVIQTKAKRIGVKKGRLVWTSEEKEFVINNKDKMSVHDMMIVLKTKSIKNIESFIKNNKENKRKKTYWTKDEENYLLNNWEIYTDSYIANEVNKTKSQVVNKRRELGLINDIKKWSIEEDNIIINMHSYTNNDELAYLLGVSKPQLDHRIKKLNLCLVKKYTFDEDDFIKMNYKTETIEDISKALGRPKSGVLDRMYKLGLHLYKEDIKNNFTKLDKKIIDFANENNIVFERG